MDASDVVMEGVEKSTSQNELNTRIAKPIVLEDDQVALLEPEETINCARFKPLKPGE